MTYFIDDEHKTNYVRLLQESNVSEGETTVKAVLYLLATTQKIVHNLNDYFVVPGKYINLSGLEKEDISFGEKRIVSFAFNLFNGYESEDVNVSPYSLFSGVDKDVQSAFIQALEIKFATNKTKSLA